jgi:hypothetical protein
MKDEEALEEKDTVPIEEPTTSSIILPRQPIEFNQRMTLIIEQHPGSPCVALSAALRYGVRGVRRSEPEWIGQEMRFQKWGHLQSLVLERCRLLHKVSVGEGEFSEFLGLKNIFARRYIRLIDNMDVSSCIQCTRRTRSLSDGKPKRDNVMVEGNA